LGITKTWEIGELDSLSAKVEIKPLEAALLHKHSLKKVRCETSLFFLPEDLEVSAAVIF
jgi:hypothetical protein